MQNKFAPFVGQIRISTSGKHHTIVTKLTAKMLFYVDCNEAGEPLPNAKEYKIWQKNADLYLGEPIPTHQ